MVAGGLQLYGAKIGLWNASGRPEWEMQAADTDRPTLKVLSFLELASLAHSSSSSKVFKAPRQELPLPRSRCRRIDRPRFRTPPPPPKSLLATLFLNNFSPPFLLPRPLSVSPLRSATSCCVSARRFRWRTTARLPCDEPWETGRGNGRGLRYSEAGVWSCPSRGIGQSHKRLTLLSRFLFSAPPIRS